jgi:hypothetical protein
MRDRYWMIVEAVDSILESRGRERALERIDEAQENLTYLRTMQQYHMTYDKADVLESYINEALRELERAKQALIEDWG